jgi:hypothetical protein
MKFTNKLGLPQPLVDAVINDPYTKGDADISVTELLDPPQMRYLKKKHEEEITEDVADRLYSLYGQVIHGILERAEKTATAERRLSIEVSGWKVGGGMDRFVIKEGLLQDYKFTTAYKVKKESAPEEWVKQLNIYAEILRQNGEKVAKLQIVAILRDWSKLEASRDAEYPQQQVVILDLPLIDQNDVLQYIKEGVKLHQEAAKGNYSECTKEERWAKDDVYAVMKIGQERAVRLCASEEAAELIKKSGQYIEKRNGISTRCEHYCPVKNFCKQYKGSKK